MSAIKYLKTVSPILRSSEGTRIKGEHSIFRLHCNFTVGLLIGSSILLTAAEFSGKAILCISTVPSNVVNTYCWISSTFTMSDYSIREVGTQAAQPGVFSPDAYDDELIQSKWKFHNYYQWVVFFLCFQAFLCYLPKYMWEMCEGGLVKSISQNLWKGIYKDSDVSGMKAVVVKYILTHLKMHNGYVFKYWTCEFLCFVNIILQLYMIDSFLGGEFMQYGFKVLDYSEMDQENRVDPMIYVFPRMTKCTFHSFGSSGTIERRDAFCLLPQNIVNEKIFIFIWFWYIALATMLGGLLLYRAVLIFLPSIRPRILYAHTKMVPLDTLTLITKRSSIGDWWILYLLSGTLDSHIYRNLLMRLGKEIQTDASNMPVYQNGCSMNNGASTSGLNGTPAHASQSGGRQVYPNPALASAPPSAYAQSSV